MAEELVTIAYEFSPPKANLMRTRLEADGIECFLRGETLTGVVGSLSYASASWNHPEGNIALQVPESQVTHAREILREIESAPHDEEEDFVTRKPSLGLQLFRLFFIGWLTFALTMFAYGATEQYWLSIIIGVAALVVMSFWAFKKSFNSKR